MPNLIPASVREKLQPIYRRRLIATWFWLAAGVCAVGAILLLPALFFLEAQKQDVSSMQIQELTLETKEAANTFHI